jgi:hypothetical protein
MGGGGGGGLRIAVCGHTQYEDARCIAVCGHIWGGGRKPTAIYVSAYCYISSVLILQYMCPHTAIYLASSYCYMCVRMLLHI